MRSLVAALMRYWFAMRATYHDMLREWYEEQGSSKANYHRERVRYCCTRIIQLRELTD